MNYARKLVEGSLEIEDVETEVHSLLQIFVDYQHFSVLIITVLLSCI